MAKEAGPDEKFCHKCGKRLVKEAEICPGCGVRQHYAGTGKEKNKILAALLAIFLGGFGIHKFYLGRIGQGVVYLLFFWTLIPALVGFIEGLVYLTMDDEKFAAKYSR